MITGNKFSHLCDGENIIFCKTDFILEDFKRIERISNNIILVTGNSDLSITDKLVDIAPSNIHKWFSHNSDTRNPLVCGIPIGLENIEECSRANHGYSWPHAIEKHSLIHLHSLFTEPTKKIYANFSMDTHSTRVRVAEICRDLDYITTDTCNTHNTINQKSYDCYLKDILDHEMVVCPRGNGIDCHRVWEVLYMGRIPIIKTEKAMDHFKNLPILMLDTWEDLKDLNLLQDKLNQVKYNSKDLLNFDYWKTLIRSYLPQ
jgi:hypothetical protein